ncbi:hypothetical protein [Caulobacter sp. S45]|uniref:hypothetical protein n=1 Tax=Caulobacter sp. S45 TaxID=1641861 RepID=UPI00131AC2CC|nr:hypothetical protein [Caulobacter sp. S45]
MAAAIAWLAPFDLAFGVATLGVPALRALAIIALALIGLYAGGRIGLGLEPRGLKRPLLTPVLVATAVALACALSDWLMRSSLHANYAQSMASSPLAPRLIEYILRAFNENIMYRLFLGSLLVWVIGGVWKASDGCPAAGAYWTGFALSQAINVWVNVTSLAPLTPLAVLHDGLRYFAPGMVWSWLYWRHGFQSNEIACTSVHLFFQPLVTLGLR